MYNSLTYIDQILPQETVWVEGNKVAGIAIHDFHTEPVRVNPEDDRFHGQLEHVRDMLEQAVLRRIYDMEPDEELEEKDILRAYAQYNATMY